MKCDAVSEQDDFRDSALTAGKQLQCPVPLRTKTTLSRKRRQSWPFIRLPAKGPKTPVPLHDASLWGPGRVRAFHRIGPHAGYMTQGRSGIPWAEKWLAPRGCKSVAIWSLLMPSARLQASSGTAVTLSG